MARKVFRIHNAGASNIDWFPSVNINNDLISSIQTDSGDGKKLPTSIPSPFARIDLVRTAFARVAEEGNLDGLERNGVSTATDNHKLISDALDIGQIFFNYDKHKDDLKLEAWDKTNSLGALLNGNSKKRHLGKTLELFLNQDNSQYNFDQFDKIYILKYKHKVIGGTSPRTLFFAAPNARDTQIIFGQDIMLDTKLLPLYKRDKDYIKYLFALSSTVDNFNENFPEFNMYLIETVEKLTTYDAAFYDSLMNLDCEEYMNSLNSVFFNNNAGEPLEIINNLPVKQFVKNPLIIERQSDFTIKTIKEVEGNKPLVLPVEPFSLRYKYTEDDWDINTIVPAEDKRPLSERTLPNQGDAYPYLTMNDFLTDSIVKLPYEVDNMKFLTVGSRFFLLPIKENFFTYFSIEDIIENDLVKIKDLSGGSVEIEISIPVKREFITYKKIYYPKSSAGTTNNDSKTGTIVEKSFALSVYPFVKSIERKISYTIGIADVSPNKNELLGVDFYHSKYTKSVQCKHQSYRAEKPIKTQQSIIDDQFDIIFIKVGRVQNVIIPKWSEYNGSSGDDYEFAIDFGTTNSHIEYKIQGHGSEKAYDISESDEQIAFLMPNQEESKLRSQSIRDILDGENHLTQEILSKQFGEGKLRNAPFRTCLIQNQNINFSKPTNIFTHTNIGFDYEKNTIRKYLKAYTDLKWASNDEDNLKRIGHYIEELLMLCKNKVLMNNGNLSNTKIIWFYPVSMTTHRLKIFKTLWQEKFEQIFDLNLDNLSNYPESIAPFYYYKANEGIHAHAKPSVSIDIGGGTSDVMIYANGEPQLITSFKFAGNSIFGDGFNGNIKSNGFVQKYFPLFKDLLIQNELKSELTILDKIYNENASSADLVNFLFSLKKNKSLLDKQVDIDFSKMLKTDSDFKIIFLLFYASIIYHIAEMMKIKGMETPRNILFSGTGSKILNIIDSDRNLGSLTKLFEAIFNEVFETDESNIDLRANANPKEITCKGGFYIDKNLDVNSHKELVEFSIGNFNDKKVQKRTQSDDFAVSYNNIDSEFRNGVIENVETFYKLFIKLNKSLNFIDEFGISTTSLKVFNDHKSTDLEDFIMAGLNAVKKDSDDDEALSETLFFYPLIGKLNELAKEINGN
ncbi:hypothetical protein [uncultured Dokdonia sp.]|uniref:hypothetical protein n=1 Tax=uncultured Dokdonia sp. TaxID=575653 RepID=UPI002623AA87|nr:hypothetical protein [uncultured Dokdonia sp.]